MRGVLVAVLALAALPAFAARAPAWGEAYERALVLVERQEWAAAADSLQKAIAASPHEELNANSGRRALSYVPYYWLGLARLNLGEIEAALVALKRSESQGVVQRTEHYAAFRKALARAEQLKREQSGSDLKAQRTVAEQAIARAVVAQATATAAGSSRKSEYQIAGRKLDEALSLLRGSPSAAEMQSSSRLAAEAAQLYEALSRPEQKPTPVVRRDAATPPPVVQAPETAIPPSPLPVPPPEAMSAPAVGAETEQLRRSIRDFEAALLDASRSRPTPALARLLEQGRVRVAAWRTELDRASPPQRARTMALEISRAREEVRAAAAASVQIVPPESGSRLREAYLQMSRGNLVEAGRILDGLLAEDSTSAAAYALRGTVRYTRALLGEGGALVAQAETDFAAALKLDPSLRLDGRHFSPKVVALFDQARQRLR